MHAYRHKYQVEYQFIRREPTPIIIPVPCDDAYSLFVAACFGEFWLLRHKVTTGHFWIWAEYLERLMKKAT